MMCLPTAKILLFIAMNLGPHDASVVYATSHSESYVWTDSKLGWTVEAKGFTASDWTRNPSTVMPVMGTPGSGDVPAYMRNLGKYNWSHPNAVVFDNGDRIEKCGDHAFYILNAGGPNEKVFTILFPNS